MEAKCSKLPMMDTFDDYVRSKGINICSMICIVGIFYHWLYVFSVTIVNSSFLAEWWMIIAWVVYAWIFPTIIFPLLTFGNNFPQNEKSIIKIVISILVSLVLVAESIIATTQQLSIKEEEGNISDMAYYFYYSSIILYICSTISGLILIGLYLRILIFFKDSDIEDSSTVSYHGLKTNDLKTLDTSDPVSNTNGSNKNNNDNNDSNSGNTTEEKDKDKDKETQSDKEVMKEEIEETAKQKRLYCKTIKNYMWPTTPLATKNIIKLIPVPSRLYQIMFAGLIGMVFDIEFSIYARNEILDTLDDLQGTIDDLNAVLNTYENITSFNVTEYTQSVDVLSNLPIVSIGDYGEQFAVLSGAASLIGDVQSDSEDAIDSLEYAIELLESLYSIGSAFADGIIVGIIFAIITGLWAIFIVKKAFYKKYINLRHKSPDFRYKASKYQLFWTSRFVGTVSSYLIIGPLLTIWFWASIVAVLGWSSFQEFIEAYWFYFFYAPLLYLFEVFIIRSCIRTKMSKYVIFEDNGSNNNNNKNPNNGRKMLYINKASFWLWYMTFNDVLFFPVSFLFAFGRYIFLQLVILSSYLRPDSTVYPRHMEDWDHGHTTFVTTVQMMIERELIFVLGKHGLQEQQASQTEMEMNRYQESSAM